MRPLFLLYTGLLFCVSTQAAVVEQNQQGFLIRHEVMLNIPAEQSYRLLVNEVHQWWNPSHTYSGNAANLKIDSRPGGCFCEQLPNGGGVQHMMVVHANPGKLLRMTGALGPMQGSGLAGSMSWQITPHQTDGVEKLQSKLVMTYSVGGYLQGGFDKMAPAVNGMLAEQIGRLATLANTGKPE